MAQAEIQAALLNHERIRKSTDLPVFNGEKDKDTIDPHDFLQRFETASNIAGWVPVPGVGQPINTARKCSEFLVLLRHTAAEWWKSLDLLPDCDKTNWDHVKREFTTTFAPRHTARTACYKFTELNQRPGESVALFFLRVTKAYRLLKINRRPELQDVRLALPNLDIVLNERGPAVEAYARLVKDEGLEDMGRYVVQAMFTAGLHEDLRIKVMEEDPVSHATAYQYALRMECILKDKKGSKPLINSVTNQDETEPDLEEEDDDDELQDQVNAIRISQGKKPIRFTSKGPKGKITVACRYCKKIGHFQRDCLKRKREKGAMIDANGKPYKIHSLENEDGNDEPENNQDDQDEQINSIAQHFYNIHAIQEVVAESNTTPENDSENTAVLDTDEPTPIRQHPPGRLPIEIPLRSVGNIDVPCRCVLELYHRRWNMQNLPDWFAHEDNLEFLQEHGLETLDDDEDNIICDCLERVMGRLSVAPHIPTPYYSCPCYEELEARRNNQYQGQVSLESFLIKHQMTSLDDEDWNLLCVCSPPLTPGSDNFHEGDDEWIDLAECRSQWFDDVGEPNPLEINPVYTATEITDRHLN